jgi:hypothetical protein
MGQLSVATVTRLVVETGNYAEAARRLGTYDERIRRICKKAGVKSKRAGRPARLADRPARGL